MRPQKYHALQEGVKAEAITLSGTSFATPLNQELRKASRGPARLSLVSLLMPFQLFCTSPAACLALVTGVKSAARFAIILP